MAYTPQSWADGPGGGTPITASTLNHIETGLQSSAAIADNATSRTGSKSVGQGEVIFNVMDYGAVGDGSTDDTAAITAANSAANAAALKHPATVLFPWTSTGYNCGQFSLSNRVTFRGENRVALNLNTSKSAFILPGGTGARLENLTINSNSNATSYGIQVGNSVTRFTVANCAFQGAPGVAHFIITGTGCTNITIMDCDVTDGATAFQIQSDVQRIRILRNTLIGWTQRGIYVTGTSSVAPSYVTLQDNYISYNSALNGASPREPISFVNTSPKQIQYVKVKGNWCFGGNTSFTAPSNPGTADQISLHGVTDFQVSDNHSFFGGDVGITVSLSCYRGVVSNNVCAFNDTNGIGLQTDVQNVTVTGNTCVSNGQNRNGDRVATGRCGIALYGTTTALVNIGIAGNILSDDQVTPTQQYGLVTSGTCTNINFGQNTYANNVTGRQTLTGTLTLVGPGFDGNSTTTAPSAGGAGALPATPKGYLSVVINGAAQQIPYY